MVGQGQKEKVQVELIEQQQLSGKKMQRCTKKSIKIARFMNPGRRLDSSLEAVVWILGGKISWRFPPRKHISTNIHDEWMGRSREIESPITTNARCYGNDRPSAGKSSTTGGHVRYISIAFLESTTHKISQKSRWNSPYLSRKKI